MAIANRRRLGWRRCTKSWRPRTRRPSIRPVSCSPHETYFGGVGGRRLSCETAQRDGRRFFRGGSIAEHTSMTHKSVLRAAMTLQPGDRVRLKPEYAAVRIASARARRDWPILIGVVQQIQRHSLWTYVFWGDNRHAD